MNKSAAALLGAFSVAFSMGYSAVAQSECHPEVIQRGAEFPARSIDRGQRGTVFMDVVVGASGRAAAVEVVDSSGYRLLDEAARQSALTHWEFDVSSCERNDLPVKHRIAVEYRNDQ